MLCFLCCYDLYFTHHSELLRASLILIQLRAAWHDSALAMNKLKEFCINNNTIEASKLSAAFHWRLASLPEANKLWNVFFYSATFIAFLSSAAFACGVALLGHNAGISHYFLFGISILYLLILFAIFLIFYHKALKTAGGNKNDQSSNSSSDSSS